MKSLLVKSAIQNTEVFIQEKIPLKFSPQRDYDRILVIYDRKVEKTLSKLMKSKQIIFESVTGGEKLKSMEGYQKLVNIALKHHLSRNSAIVAIGGGTVGDAVGFLASSFKRGVDWYFMPTTTLSMIDSSVGGKVGLNFNGTKNMLGAFYPPIAVYCCLDFLKTLSERDYRAGYVEHIKHCLLQDKNKFKESLQKIELDEVKIFDSLRFKGGLVQKDEMDSSGIREKLNIGHTLGHAFESLCDLKHGEAVYHGLKKELELSKILGVLEEKVADDILADLNQIKMPSLKISNTQNLKKLLAHDKKNNKIDSCKLLLLQDFGKTSVQYCSWKELKFF